MAFLSPRYRSVTFIDNNGSYAGASWGYVASLVNGDALGWKPRLGVQDPVSVIQLLGTAVSFQLAPKLAASLPFILAETLYLDT